MIKPKTLAILTVFGGAILAVGLIASENKKPALIRQIIQWGGLERSYQAHVPPVLHPHPAIVVVLHGGGGSAERMVKLEGGRFNELADLHRFVVVYPSGVEGHWNDGRRLENWRAHRESIDDVSFISAVISDVSHKHGFVASGIYVTGISNGGLMAFRLACELPDKIAGIAPVTASLSEDLIRFCKPNHPVSVMIVNGTEDPIVPYDGGTIRFGSRKLGKVISTNDTARFWAKWNECASSPEIIRVAERDHTDGTTLRKEVYGGCKRGVSVVLYAVEGGGHTWPGGDQYLPRFIVGRVSREFNAADEIWSFFALRQGAITQ